MLGDYSSQLVPKDAPSSGQRREHTFSSIEYLGHGVCSLFAVGSSLVYGGIEVGMDTFFFRELDGSSIAVY